MVKEYFKYIKALFHHTHEMTPKESTFESIYTVLTSTFLFICLLITFVRFEVSAEMIRLIILLVGMQIAPYLYRKYITKTLDDLLKD